MWRWVSGLSYARGRYEDRRADTTDEEIADYLVCAVTRKEWNGFVMDNITEISVEEGGRVLRVHYKGEPSTMLWVRT